MLTFIPFEANVRLCMADRSIQSLEMAPFAGGVLEERRKKCFGNKWVVAFFGTTLLWEMFLYRSRLEMVGVPPISALCEDHIAILRYFQVNAKGLFVTIIERANFANQDGSRSTHDYRILYSLRQHLWSVLCQKQWQCSNVRIHNDYFVAKLLAFVFKNISIVIYCNSILNGILFLILHLHIITWKWQQQRPKEFLKYFCILFFCRSMSYLTNPWEVGGMR
jgi:hypothetical protein